MTYRRLALPAVFSLLVPGCATNLALDGNSLAGGVSAAVSSASSTASSAFAPGAFYRITTVVDGAEVALTFIPPEGAAPGTLTMSPSSASVALKPVTNGPDQQWQPRAQAVEPGDVYTLSARISDDTGRLTGVLELQNPTGVFSDDPPPENNRVTVGYYSNENVEYWLVTRAPDGRYRIASLLAAPSSLNTPGAEPVSTLWNEARALTAVKGPDGAIVLRHDVIADKPGQLWTITRL
jgi:hypothetical protein